MLCLWPAGTGSKVDVLQECGNTHQPWCLHPLHMACIALQARWCDVRVGAYVRMMPEKNSLSFCLSFFACPEVFLFSLSSFACQKVNKWVGAGDVMSCCHSGMLALPSIHVVPCAGAHPCARTHACGTSMVAVHSVLQIQQPACVTTPTSATLLLPHTPMTVCGQAVCGTRPCGTRPCLLAHQGECVML